LNFAVILFYNTWFNAITVVIFLYTGSSGNVS
jgi:hypothetical protein